MTEKLQRIPFLFFFLVYAIYLGYQFYDFSFDRGGETEMHKANMIVQQGELQDLKGKLVEGKRFLESIDEKKRSIQAQVKKLEEYHGSMSENLDVPAMIKMMVTEGKRSGLKVDKIEPGKRTVKEFYLEQEFKVDVHGSYASTLQYFQRISQIQKILRVEGFNIKPQAIITPLRNTILESQLSIRSYQYLIGKEDKIGREQR